MGLQAVLLREDGGRLSKTSRLAVTPATNDRFFLVLPRLPFFPESTPFPSCSAISDRAYTP